MSNMTKIHWKVIEEEGFFNRKENWGDPYAIDEDYMALLNDFRRFIGRPYTLNYAYATSGHNPKSAHYKGQASDGSIKNLSLIQEFTLATHFKDINGHQFKGIGIYPTWGRANEPKPGLHLDNMMRENVNRLFWIEDNKGSASYRYFTDENAMYEELLKISNCINIY